MCEFGYGYSTIKPSNRASANRASAQAQELLEMNEHGMIEGDP